MEKQEIIQKLESLTDSADILAHKNELRTLSKSLRSILKKEQEEIEELQNNPEAEFKIDEAQKVLSDKAETLLESIKTKINDAKKAIEKEEKENLEAKKLLIRRFQLLIQNEENLGKLFNDIKEIREEWKCVGNIPSDKFQDIQNQYSQLNDLFNYNVQMYKELKENDLKKNYTLKNQIIEQVKELAGEKNIRNVEKAIRKLQNDWEEVGPTFNEHWEKLKEDFWSNVQSVYNRIKEHYSNLEAEREKNHELKKGLITKAEETVKDIPNDIKGFEKITNALTKLQENWKKIGFAPKEVNDQIWDEFRSHFNKFYEAKSEFFKERKQEFTAKKEQKESLIAQAAEIVGNENWKQATQKIIGLQKKWKQVGSAGHFENRLWKEFREKCDAFFDQKNKFFEEKDKAFIDNLKEKQAVIKEIEDFKPSADKKNDVASLKEFSKKFAAIGNVPFKQKDEVYDAYKSALDKQYKDIKVSDSEKTKMMFNAKIESLQEMDNPVDFIRREKRALKGKLEGFVKDLANYEHNFSFFGNSNPTSDLLKGVVKNIENTKATIEELRGKIKTLTLKEKSILKEQKEAEASENKKEENA